MVTGAVVVLRWPDMEVVEVQTVEGAPTFPYIPGLLAFREAPVLMGALERLAVTPDVIVVDGQGTAHPRRFGLACHIGLLTQLPSVGCAKSVLRGRHGPLDAARGSWAPLVDGGEVVGAAVRTRDRVSPVYVSVGHKVDIATARALVLSCCKDYGCRADESRRTGQRRAGSDRRTWMPSRVLNLRFADSGHGAWHAAVRPQIS